MSKISLFTPAFSKTPSSEISIDEFINNIRFGKWRKEVEEVRNEPDPDKRKLLKQSVAGVTISGTFSQRNESSLLSHSSVLCVDIDGYTNREGLLTDPYTYCIFSSISNSGLAVLVKIEPNKHKESFRWIQEHYFKTFGIPVDPAPSSVASLRFISYDPQLFYNEKSKICKFNVKKQKPVNSLPVFYPTDAVGEMVQECVSLGKNIAESYHEYLTLGFSIAAGFGENGRSYFHALAGVSPKYNSAHCDRQYDFCLRNPDGGITGGITVGSFYFMLKQAGINFPANALYENAIRVAAIHKKSNLTQSGSVATLVEICHVPEEDAKKIVKEVHSRPDITLSSIAADPEKLIESLVAWIKANHPIKKNILTSKLENSDGEITKERFNSIYLQARAAFNTPNITFDLIERILFSEITETYNPIKEYIDSNRHRNTTGNIDRIIQSINTETPNAALFIRKWFIAIPAAIDGEPIRLVLALTGGQLTGKTEFFRRLLPDRLKKYYGESKMEAGKDDELLMCQKLIIMDDELSGKTKQDEARFKDLTSKNFFSLRAPYDKSNMDYKRLALLCGTSNEKEIINDPTGNTRILPVEVTSIDHEMYNAVDKDELFIEIVRAYESGEKWNFKKEELDSLSTTSTDFEGIHFERELITKYFVHESESEGVGFAENMTATEIKAYIETHSMQKIISLKKLGIELRKSFGEPKSVKKNGLPIKMYSVVKIQSVAGSGYSVMPATKFEPYVKYEEFDL